MNEYISGAVKAVGEELVQVSCHKFAYIDWFACRCGVHGLLVNTGYKQGTVAKVVVVIKDKEDAPLERFVFALESMIEVEAFNKDTRYVSKPIIPFL